MSGYCHLRFAKAADVVQDLQFALSRDTGIIVTSVAPGGLAQRNGVYPGCCVKSVNGDPHNPRERLLAALSEDMSKPLELDLLSPTPNCHGMPSLGDAVVRAPLAPPGFLD